MSRQETRDGYPVVCVKFYGSQLPDGGTESQRELAYERARADWWEDATEKAKELGFSDVYALGRSGGWIAPHYDRRAPDLDEPRQRKAFDAFAAWVRNEMRPAPLADRFQAYLEDEIDSTPEPVPAPPANECERFLAYCENRSDRAALSSDREFWRRLAGSVRKAMTM